jgi:hypothetical protein
MRSAAVGNAPGAIAALSAARRALVSFEAVGDQRGMANAKRWAGRSLILLEEIGEGEIFAA